MCAQTARYTSHEQLFAEWRERFEGVQGYLHPMEGFTLAMLAMNGPGEGAIVEIGSFMGRSTCWLAAGSIEGGREVVHAVDHFKGSPEHQAWGSHPVKAIADEGSTFNKFRENIRRIGFEHHVTPIPLPSIRACVQWEGPIRLLFIDGDHSYEETKGDFDLWSPFIAPGGVVAFHDVGAWKGVTQFVNEMSASNKAWKQISAVNTLRVFQRAA